jgi:hypothetical protein
VNAGRLEIDLVAGIARLQRDANEALGIVRGFASTTDSILKTLAAGISVGAITAFAKHTVDAIGKMKDLGLEVGTSAEAISRFEAPTRSAGLSLDDTATAMFRMSKAALEAKDPTSKAAQALQAIGISTSQLKGLKADEMFELVARQVAKYSDGISKNNVMMELFNKSGREMNRVTAEIAKTTELTATVTEQQALEAKKLGDEMLELKMSSEKFWRGILSEGLPALNSLIKAFIEAKEKGGLLDGVFAALATAAGNTAVDDLQRVNEQLDVMRKNIESATNGWRAFVFTDEERAEMTRKLNILLTEQARLERVISAEGIAEQNRRAIAGQQARLANRGDPNFDPAAAAKVLKDYNDALAKAAQMDAEVMREVALIMGNLNDLGAKRVLALDDEIERYKLETDAIGQTNLQRELELLDYKKKLDLRGVLSEVDRQSIERKYDELRAMAVVRDSRQIEFDQQKMQIDMWRALGDASKGFFEDLVMHGTSAFGRLWETVKQFFAQMVALFATRWVLQLGASLLGSTALSSVAGQLGQGTASGFLSSALSNYFGSTALGGAANSFMMGFSGAQGPVTSSLMQSFGSGLSGALPILGYFTVALGGAAIAANQFAHGWRINNPGGSDFRTNNPASPLFTASAMDRTYRALGLSDRWAAILSGSSLATRIFGRRGRTNDAYGISGDIGMGGFTGGDWQDWSEQGGWFSSTRRGTDTTGFTPDQQQFLGSLFQGLAGVTSPLASFLGVNPSTALAGYSHAFNFQLSNNGNPLPDDQISSLFSGLMSSVLQEQVAQLLDAGGKGDLAEYIRGLTETGDALTHTITDFVDVMQAAPTMGLDVQAVMRLQRAGETLTDTFNRLAQGWSSYVSNFYTADEQRTMGMAALQHQLDQFGVTLPTTREAFRHLVETTEAGSPLWEALIGMAGTFADLVPAANAATGAINGTANALNRPNNPIFGSDGMHNGTPGDGGGGSNMPSQEWIDAWNRQMAQQQDLGSFLGGLLGNSSLSPLSPMEQLEAARQAWMTNPSASTGQAYLQVARQLYGSSSSYQDIFHQVYDTAAGIVGAPDYNARMEQIQTGMLDATRQSTHTLGLILAAQDTTNQILQAIADRGTTRTDTVVLRSA